MDAHEFRAGRAGEAAAGATRPRDLVYRSEKEDGADLVLTRRLRHMILM